MSVPVLHLAVRLDPVGVEVDEPVLGNAEPFVQLSLANQVEPPGL